MFCLKQKKESSPQSLVFNRIDWLNDLCQCIRGQSRRLGKVRLCGWSDMRGGIKMYTKKWSPEGLQKSEQWKVKHYKTKLKERGDWSGRAATSQPSLKQILDTCQQRSFWVNSHANWAQSKSKAGQLIIQIQYSLSELRGATLKNIPRLSVSTASIRLSAICEIRGSESIRVSAHLLCTAVAGARASNARLTRLVR